METQYIEQDLEICEFCVHQSTEKCFLSISTISFFKTERCIESDHFDPREGTNLYEGKRILDECEKLWTYCDDYPHMLKYLMTDYYKIKDTKTFLDHLKTMKNQIVILEDLLKSKIPKN